MSPELPTAGSYWVEPGALLAGEYPGARDRREATDRLGRFTDAGIGLFVDLTEPGELEPYASLLHGARHERRPIPDMGTTSPTAYREILDLVDDALGRDERVYVHCFGGIGRTGTVVGCWLVRHGLDSGDPMRQIATLRRDVPAAWQPSPQTAAQRRVVEGWKLGD